jgi:hypothetical protein
MNLFADNSSHHWLSFVLGILTGLVTVFVVKRFRRKEER